MMVQITIRPSQRDGGQFQERDAMSKMIAHVTGNHIAERRAYAGGRTDDALREVEMTGAESDVGGNEGNHDAKDRSRDAVQHLHGDQQRRIIDRRKQHSPKRQRGEGDHEQRAASPRLRLAADRRRHQRDDRLRDDDAERNQHRRPLA